MLQVDITGWRVDDEFSPYPEGSRDKYALYAPTEDPPANILTGHRYLLKFSNARYPVQYWSELVAFILAGALGVPCPRTFVTFDAASGRGASLSEWFYGAAIEEPLLVAAAGTEHGLTEDLVQVTEIPETHSLYVPGSNYMTRRIPDYDLRKGKQHNFTDIAFWVQYFLRKYGLNYWPHWTNIITFDALIGNTDRHQDNWGVLWRRKDADHLVPRFSPAFDNGTSLLHEITEENLSRFDDIGYVRKYILRGTHHCS